MSDTKKEIKPQNVPRLALFFAVNVAALFIVASGETEGFTIQWFITNLGTIQNGAIVLVTSLAVIVLDGVVPNGVKDFLVFWRWPYPLPGCRAFTEFAPKRPERINIVALKKYADPLPTGPVEQNKLWLDLSVKYQAEPSVTQAHRSFLLTKEMTSLGALFLALFPLMLHLVGTVSTRTVLIYAGALFVQYLVTSTSSRNYGEGFVVVVLARASSTV